MASGPSITFSAYLTGGVPDGAPLWRDPPASDGEAGGNGPPARATGPGGSIRNDVGEIEPGHVGTPGAPDGQET